ncbi:MAG: hypothetical protein IKW87_10475 [Ruminococcus sp.]|nr:hypothetical protein [Ruminococcus sp.]
MDKIFDKFNDDEEQMLFGEDMRKYELYVIVPYIIPILFFLPIAIDKESEFCKFHANQSLCWCIVFFLLEGISGVIGFMNTPLDIFLPLFTLFSLACMAFLVVGAWKGYAIRIPVLGNIINVFK